MLNDVYQEFLMNMDTRDHFRLLSQEDRSMKVRQAALEALKVIG